jgi:membrane-associated phospholipid phosphatase
MAHEHRGFRRFLAGRLDPEVRAGLLLTVALGMAIMGGLALALLAYLTRSVAAIQDLDDAAAEWGNTHATAASTSGIKAITFLGETTTAIAVALVVCAVDAVRSRTPMSFVFLAAVIGGQNLLTSTVKDLAHRIRPAFDPIAETLGPSFPSGHTATAAACYAGVALVMGRRLPHRSRAWIAGGAVGIAVGVAASRVLLRVHWVTDVIGGLALGWGWFALCSVAFAGRILRPAVATGTAEHAAQGREAADTVSPHSNGRNIVQARQEWRNEISGTTRSDPPSKEER